MESMEKMKTIDVRTVARESLVDIKELEEEKIAEEWTVGRCAEKFVERVKNPYCFRVGKIIVKTVFSEGATLNQRFEEFIDSYD